jgi:hypothetical protein
MDTMALTPITPTRAYVRWDRKHARPTAVRVGGRELKVTAVDAVRDETAAYPAERGPRVTFLVESSGGQATLVFDPRGRSWTVVALDLAA